MKEQKKITKIEIIYKIILATEALYNKNLILNKI